MSGVISLNYFDNYVDNYAITTPFTTDGGYFMILKNLTNQTSIKGQIVVLSNVQPSCVQLSSNSSEWSGRKTLGAFVESGVTANQNGKIAVMGKVPLLLKDGVSANVGDKLIRGSTDGRVEIGASTYDPNAMDFVGYAIESATSGTNVTVLAYVPMK